MGCRVGYWCSFRFKLHCLMSNGFVGSWRSLLGVEFVSGVALEPSGVAFLVSEVTFESNVDWGCLLGYWGLFRVKWGSLVG